MQQNMRRGGVQGLAMEQNRSRELGQKRPKRGFEPFIRGELIVKTRTWEGARGAEWLKLESSIQAWGFWCRPDRPGLTSYCITTASVQLVCICIKGAMWLTLATYTHSSPAFLFVVYHCSMSSVNSQNSFITFSCWANLRTVCTCML